MGSMAVVQFLAEARVCLYSTASRQVLRPTHPPNQWVLGVSSLEIKGPSMKLTSPPTSAEVKKGEAITPLLHIPSRCGAQRL
jgi:hypothetical protein